MHEEPAIGVPVTRVAVVGASGFIGSAVCRALAAREVDLMAVRAPRLASSRQDALDEAVDHLVLELTGATVVVNAAGLAAAAEHGEDLNLANGVLPGLVGRAAMAASVPRYVHVSSAAVQGRRRVLDDSRETQPFSAYSRSKATGEEAALSSGPIGTTVYRPAGVHGPGRSVTQTVARISRSPFASVAGSGSAPAPHALIDNVADAIAFLSTTEAVPPRVVHHPHEGLSTAELLTLLGGRPPRHIPSKLAEVALAMGFRAFARRDTMCAQLRRLEVLWMGQLIAPSWLEEVGWTPPVGHGGWSSLREGLKREP
jgi:nucleoside-diphosphate-sugar epimerase